MADLWKLPGVSADAKKEAPNPKKRAVRGVKMATENVKKNLKKKLASDKQGNWSPRTYNDKGVGQAREGLAEATSAAKDAGVKGSKVKRMTRGAGKTVAQKPARMTTRLLGETGKQSAKSDAAAGRKLEKPGAEKATNQQGSFADFEAKAAKRTKMGDPVVQRKIVSVKKAAKYDASMKKNEAKQIKGYDKAAKKAVGALFSKAEYKK
jgi:hypothetical protein